MEDTVNLVQDPKDGAVRMFVCCNDTQQRHEWENKAGGESKRDAESGLYDPGTMKRITDALIGEETYRTCTMSMIRSLGEICPNQRSREDTRMDRYGHGHGTGDGLHRLPLYS